MQKLTLLMLLFCSLCTSCTKDFSTDFTKKHKANFKVNGTAYNCDENNVSASYFKSGSTQYLQINCIGSAGQTNTVNVVVDLTRINETVSIGNNEDGFTFYNTSGAPYISKRGTWKVTSHKEGNPSSRHTEGNFEMTVYSATNPSDSLVISEGYFYVNNY